MPVFCHWRQRKHAFNHLPLSISITLNALHPPPPQPFVSMENLLHFIMNSESCIVLLFCSPFFFLHFILVFYEISNGKISYKYARKLQLVYQFIATVQVNQFSCEVKINEFIMKYLVVVAVLAVICSVSVSSISCRIVNSCEFCRSY